VKRAEMKQTFILVGSSFKIPKFKYWFHIQSQRKSM